MWNEIINLNNLFIYNNNLKISNMCNIIWHFKKQNCTNRKITKGSNDESDIF